jgi:hypothetical protein
VFTYKVTVSPTAADALLANPAIDPGGVPVICHDVVPSRWFSSITQDARIESVTTPLPPATLVAGKVVPVEPVLPERPAVPELLEAAGVPVLVPPDWSTAYRIATPATATVKTISQNATGRRRGRPSLRLWRASYLVMIESRI